VRKFLDGKSERQLLDRKSSWMKNNRGEEVVELGA
jgi:hypothetical protein